MEALLFVQSSMKLYCTLTNKTDFCFVVLHTSVATHEIKLDYVIK